VAVFVGPFLAAASASAADDPQPPPTTLWQHFPLNPTGQRLREQPEVRGVLRPPRPEPASPGGGSTPALFAGVAALATFVLVLAAFSIGAGLTSGRRARTGTAERRPAAYVSAFFVGSRWLPVVDEASGIEARRSSAGPRVAVAVGLAVAFAVALLVLRYG
jgi:hypothetical protein